MNKAVERHVPIGIAMDASGPFWKEGAGYYVPAPHVPHSVRASVDGDGSTIRFALSYPGCEVAVDDPDMESDWIVVKTIDWEVSIRWRMTWNRMAVSFVTIDGGFKPEECAYAVGVSIEQADQAKMAGDDLRVRCVMKILAELASPMLRELLDTADQQTS